MPRPSRKPCRRWRRWLEDKLLPFVLVLIGLLLIATGYQGTYAQFGKLVAGEFTGKPNFLYFIAAFGAIGAIGYIDALRTFSRLMMTLVLIVIVVANKGFFAKLQAALAAGPTAPNAVPAASSSSSSSSLPGLSGSMSGDISSLTNFLLNPSGASTTTGGTETSSGRLYVSPGQ